MAPITFDAGPGFDAGEPGPSPEAGPPVDAGLDAADAFVPPAPKGVTVTVIENLLPKADVRVIAQDASGAVIGEQKTDATGKLTIAKAPSIVTVLTTSNTAPAPVSYFGVTDGDNLVVRVGGSLVDPAPVGQYSVTFTPPAVAPIPTASVVAGGSCMGNTQDTSNPILVVLYPGCVGASTAVLADGSNVNGGRAGFAFKKGVAKPALNATADVLLGAWSAPGVTTLTSANTPVGTSAITADLYMIADGGSFFAGGGAGAIDDGGLSFATATGFPDADQSFVRADQRSAGGSLETGFIRREPPPAGAALPVFDFANALPYITATAVDTTTAAQPMVTLTSGSLTAVDGGLVVLSWTTNGDRVARWTFVVPASAAATFKAPALPADADALTFTPSGGVNVDSAAFFEATQIPGYKETKALPIVPATALDLLGGSIPLPANGTVRVTTWTPAQL